MNLGLNGRPAVAVYGDSVEEQAARIPARTFGRPEDFGRVVDFLCSDHPAFIIGAAIPVDGGEYAGLL